MPEATLSLDAFGTRLSGLETDFADFRKYNDTQFSKIEGLIGRLGDKFEARAKTPWGTLLSGAGLLFMVIVGIGGAVYYPVKDEQARTAAIMDKLADGKLSAKEADATDRANDRRFARLENDLGRLQEATVPREEHKHVWELQDRWMQTLSTRIDELRGLSQPQNKR